MAYQLKTTGLAADLLICLMIDEDGTTLKEFVNGYTSSTSDGGTTWTDTDATLMDVEDGVLVNTYTWKAVNGGAAMPAFETQPDGTFNALGVLFPAGIAIPGDTGESGFGAFAALAGAGAGSGNFRAFLMMNGNESGLMRGSDDRLQWHSGAFYGDATSTILPTDGTTKFSIAANYSYSDTFNIFYGLESSTLAIDGSITTDGRALDPLDGVGGLDGQGNQPHKALIWCVFDRHLTEAEYQSLHNDWFDTLFQGPKTVSGSGDLAASTATLSGSGSVVTPPETVTVSLTDINGNARASLSNIRWRWRDSFTGTDTDTGTAESTDGSGQLVLELANTTLTSGQVGYCQLEWDDGAGTFYRGLYRFTVD